MTVDRGKTVRGTRDLALGEALGFAANFVRYLVLARILGPEDFGVAATFALTVQVLQTISNMALNMLMVQSKKGEEAALLATAHSVQLVRGLVNGGLILVFAWPVSAMFGVPEARWAFQVLAVVPILEGFLHLDVFRMERAMRFRPGIAASLVPKVLSAAAAWPVAAWLQDYSASLWLLVGQGVVAVVASHALAERPYKLAWDKASLTEILGFGWPLLLNGMLFFTISQGDRLLVGTAYTMADLGLYSVAAGLVMTLSGSLFKVVQTLTLPALSRAQEEPRDFLRRHRLCVGTFSLIAAVYGAVLVIAGQPVVVILYGEPYRAAGVLLGWLAASQAIRLLRLAPSLSAMAKGDTQSLMYANAYRLTGVVAAVIAVLMRADLAWVAASSVLGEMAALWYPVRRLSRRHNLPASSCFWPFAAALFCIGLSGAIVAAGARDAVITVALTLLGVVLVGMAGWAAVSFSSFRQRLARVGGMLLPGQEGAERP
ncbi:MAG TPA: oligosaccharide flippase family protein [Candidatus Bathyarchaeia archaeon]|nr:oligosaccharide flippase family protein [Candidatus Bathyarchaeia archaeon]